MHNMRNSSYRIPLHSKSNIQQITLEILKEEQIINFHSFTISHFHSASFLLISFHIRLRFRVYMLMGISGIDFGLFGRGLNVLFVAFTAFACIFN